ncbi:MAG: hypothetical protein IJ405_07165 [Lachnospiraceae bacterium]|nr:hypothetical protein [Lachnospiraceae bacterium]
MKKRKYYIKMAVGILLLCVALVFVTVIPTQAMPPVQIIPEFENMGENSEHNFIKQFNNYFLDYIPGGLAEIGNDMVNQMANMEFDVIKLLGLVVCTIFYYALDFNLADMFQSEIGTIQDALRDSVFEPLFLIGFAGSAIILLKRFAKRDMVGSFTQILKVIGIVVLSYLVVSQSGTVMREATHLTASIGAQILSGTNGETTADYATEAAGEIWVNLVHRPWLHLEFGDNEYSEWDVYQILGNVPTDSARVDIINTWEHGDAFSGSRCYERAGFMLFYMIPFFIKSVLFLVMGGLLLILQLMAVLYVFLAPLVLILALIPEYEGILGKWLKKLLESQLSILIMYFIVGILLKIDRLLFDNLSATWGWMTVLIVQVVLYLGVIFKRNEIFGAMSKLGISNPGAAVNARLHDARAAKMAVVREIADRRQRSAAKAGAKAASSKQIENKAKTTRKRKKQPERPVMANANQKAVAVVPVMNRTAGGAGHATSSGAHREPLRPKTVTFTERQVKFEFEPSGAATGTYGRATGNYNGTGSETYGQESTVQRPRMDAFFTEAVQQEWTVDWGHEVYTEPTQERRQESRQAAAHSHSTGTVQPTSAVTVVPARNVRQTEIPVASFREVSDSRVEQQRDKKRREIKRPQSVKERG